MFRVFVLMVMKEHVSQWLIKKRGRTQQNRFIVGIVLGFVDGKKNRISPDF